MTEKILPENPPSQTDVMGSTGAEITRLREIVERAQAIISSTYLNWHAAAEGALAEISMPTLETSGARALSSGPSSRAHSEVETDGKHEQGSRKIDRKGVQSREIGGRGSFLTSGLQCSERDVRCEDGSNDRQVTDGGGLVPPLLSDVTDEMVAAARSELRPFVPPNNDTLRKAIVAAIAAVQTPPRAETAQEVDG